MGARVRTGAAFLALLGLGVILVTAILQHTIKPQPVVGGGWKQWLLTPPIGLALFGLAAKRGWGRWLGIAIGITVLPWGMVLTFDPLLSSWQGYAMLGAALLLIVSLVGRAMVGLYEAHGSGSWTGPRMRWLRWAMIGNMASVLGLLLFVAAYDFQPGSYFLLFLALMAGLVIGILFLANQLTIGLLLVWLCCVLLIPVGVLFVRASTRDTGEALLFLVMFLPGVVTGWATAFVFGRPVWRYLRA